MQVIIVGAGGHGQVVADILYKMWTRGRDIELAGYVDDNPELDAVLGLKVLGSLADLEYLSHDGVVVAIGDNARRKAICEELAAKGEHFVSAIHPTAVLAPDVCVEPGAMICAGAILNPGAVVGRHAIVNTAATVDHHCRLCAYCHVGPGAHLGGEVLVGEGALLGIGSCVTPRTEIGEWAVLGAGSAACGPVPPRAVFGGVPAKTLK